uniref:Reverse transcriptase domain-containing protein n=1 Tax=Lactuca sativa TaxID=4236 RepID=A0A9R1VZQ0_LACSA|nr:hypothetical protein LSAT_V11C400178840 [Lactuca sativa]
MYKSLGIFRGIKVPHSETTISHLFYVDDALFVGEWNQDNIKNLARVLRCFQVASGLKVNFSKSRVFGIEVDTQEITRWAAPLGCGPASLSFTYLGIPVGANMKLKKHWKPIIDRFYSKLSPWKAKNLSFGGRLTLAKAVLGVIEILEKIRRQFLWGGGDNKYKISWVSREKVIAPKEKGGLGLGSLRAFNLAVTTQNLRLKISFNKILLKVKSMIQSIINIEVFKTHVHYQSKTFPG